MMKKDRLTVNYNGRLVGTLSLTDGDQLTLPTYMQFLLDLEPEELVLEPIDTTALNSLARQILGKDD